MKQVDIPCPNDKELILQGYFQAEDYFVDYKQDIVNMYKNLIKYDIDSYLRLDDS